MSRIFSRMRKKASTTLGIPLLARALAQDISRADVTHSLAIRPIARHRVEGIGHGHDPGHLRNLFAGQPERITVAVPRFMMMPHDRQNVRRVASSRAKSGSRFRDGA